MSRRAFTLLECVVALALFTLCASILLQTLAGTRLALFQGLRGMASDADRRLAMRTILTAPDRRSAIKDGKLTTPEGDTLRWACDITPTETVDLHRVTVRLRRETKDGDATETTVTLFALRPAWSVPEDRAALLARKRSAFPRLYPEN